MSTIQKVNFSPVSDLFQVQRRDFPLADQTLADPLNGLALVDGEWVTLNASSQLVRATNIASAGNRASVASYPVWAERGRTDVQAMSQRKVPIFFMGQYEAETRVFDATAALGSGAAITTMQQGLKVATITIGGRNYSGLVGHGGTGDSDPIVGYVTRLPASNAGQLRFKGGVGRN